MESAYHRLERWSIVVDELVEPVFRPLNFLRLKLSPLLAPLARRTYPAFLSFQAKLGMGTFHTAPTAKDSETNIALWEEARARDIELKQFYPFGLRRNLFVARFNGKTVAFDGLPRISPPSKAIAWMDNKAEMKKRFLKAGFPVARGATARSIAQATKIFQTLTKPVVAKPHINTGGRHTTVNIRTEPELIAGYRNARLLSPAVIIEEELKGPVFRATLINRKLSAILRRDPPHVIGDDKHTIKQLVDEENKNPLRRGPVFAPIATDIPGIDYALVPKQGEKVFFDFKVNWGVGGTSRDATDETHPANKKLFEDIGRYLDDDIVGIDFMIEDIARPWQEQSRCGVIECNSLPLIGNHHFPFTGPKKNVAGAIWDMVYPESRI